MCPLIAEFKENGPQSALCDPWLCGVDGGFHRTLIEVTILVA